ncbi:MAG: tetratricopeptide repeat protein [Candidatus Niyogibacteria bacterium]|nr:tetratricopeptide repeat protein [Candidatus Niyogibacteria bacterium]
MENMQSSFRQESYEEIPDANLNGPSGEYVGESNRNFLTRVSGNHVARIFFYAIVALIPLWMLPLTILPMELNKAFLFSCLLLLAFIAWLIGRIQDGEFLLPTHFLALALALLVAVSVVSGLFSVSSHASFVGLGHEPGTVVSFVLFALAALLASFLFQEKKHIQLLLIVFAFSSAVLFVLQMLHMFIGVSPWSFIFNTPSGNPIGTWNAFGLYWGFIGFLFLFFAKDTSDKRIQYLFYAVAIASAIMLIAVNFQTAWILYAIFHIILFAYLYSFRRKQAGLHWEPFLAILIALFFLITPVLGQEVSGIFGGERIEIRPSWTATWEVARSTVTDERLLLGSGPNTFLYDWLQYKPFAINTTPFWAARFNTGVSFFPTLLATLGVLGGFIILFFIGTIFFYGIRTVLRFALLGDRNHTYAIGFFLSAVYLFFALLFYTPGYSLTLFFFLFLGFFAAQASREGAMSYLRIPLFQNAGIGFVASLLLLFLSVGSIAGVYLLGQKYVAAIVYGKGVTVFNQEGNAEKARDYFIRAIRLDARDRYARSLVDAELARMGALLNRSDLSQDELRNRFQTILAGAIQAGQQAAALNSVDSDNWFAFGRVYEAVIPFQIEGAAGFADSMYERAQEQNPRNPEALFARARVQVQLGNLDDANSLLQQAINIKSDYAPARFLLAQIEAQQGNTKGAIEETRNAQFLLPKDIGVLFQLGILYYQDGQFENARQVFERAIELNQNYSNARYFLGLIYDRQGDTETAISHFERVSELNPDNDEVRRILTNLRSGAPALENITPPPEERKSPPVE